MRAVRLDDMEQYIRENGTVPLEILSTHFNVSMNTIRRAIALLEQQGRVEKIFGGVRMPPSRPTGFQARNIRHLAEKQRIGAAAAQLVENNDVIYVGPGSTPMQMLPFLDKKTGVTVITNNLCVMEMCSVMEHISLISLPGRLLHGNLSFNDPEQTAYFDQYNVRSAFLPAAGISKTHGITYGSLEEAAFGRHVLSRCKLRVAMADRSKFDTVGLVTMTDFNGIDIVITDTTPPAGYKESIEKNGAKLVIAKR